MSRRRPTVNAAVEHGRLVITVEDDGKGMTGEKLEYVRQSRNWRSPLGRSASIGPNNVSERCQLYFGRAFPWKPQPPGEPGQGFAERHGYLRGGEE